MQELLKKYPYRTELHAHTSPASGCAEMTPEEVVDHYQKIGANALVITNHFNLGYFGRGEYAEMMALYIDGYRRARKRGERCGIEVILGIEIRFSENENDYLVFGIDEEDLPVAYTYLDGGIDAFYRGFKNERNVILQAHPFRNKMVLADPSSIDGIEVFNMHIGHNSRVARAVEYANEHPEFLISGGTDCHHTWQTTPCLMRSAVLPKTSFDVARMLKGRSVLFEVGGNIILPKSIKM